eukprot:6381083-Alexandrium_andersonii.AAC.1
MGAAAALPLRRQFPIGKPLCSRTEEGPPGPVVAGIARSPSRFAKHASRQRGPDGLHLELRAR